MAPTNVLFSLFSLYLFIFSASAAALSQHASRSDASLQAAGDGLEGNISTTYERKEKNQNQLNVANTLNRPTKMR